LNISYPARVPHSLLNKSTSLGLSSTNYAEGIPPVDHVPNMTGMIQPLRKSIDIKRCKGFCKLIYGQMKVLKPFTFVESQYPTARNCIYWKHPYSDITKQWHWWLHVCSHYVIGCYRYDSLSLTGSQLNWSIKEKVCIHFGVKPLKDLLDNRYLILMTDHMNLRYINVTFTGKVLRWKIYLQDKDFIRKGGTSICS
jgi:hypothetical protein